MSLSLSASKPSRTRLGLWNPQWAVYSAAIVALIVYLPTLQLEVNGTFYPYKTDVGEIQNALPRWGTLHDSGYPLYALLGSAFVTGLRLLGVPPAAGASLFSAVWGAIAVGLLARLALDFEVPPDRHRQGCGWKPALLRSGSVRRPHSQQRRWARTTRLSSYSGVDLWLHFCYNEDIPADRRTDFLQILRNFTS